MNYSDIINVVKKLPPLPNYRNNTSLVNIGGGLKLADIVKACLIARLNMLFIGEKGSGKTQLMTDINNSVFGGEGVLIRARKDMEMKELYTNFNMDNYKMELTPLINAPFICIDEINRAPEVIQNEFFHMCDGYIEYEGKRINLGKNGYHVVMASANVGSSYTGTFSMDPALLDRFSVIINVDDYPVNLEDNIALLMQANSTEPRIMDAEKEVHFEEIYLLNKSLKESADVFDATFTLDALIMLLYLKEGLSYCLPELSYGTANKAAIKTAIPQVCVGCNRLGKGCGYIKPCSERFIKTLKGLIKAIILVSAANKKVKKAEMPEISYMDILKLFAFLAPYKDIVDRNFIMSEYKGNPAPFIQKFIKDITSGIAALKDAMCEALVMSLKGQLNDEKLSPFKNEWDFYGRFLSKINELAIHEGNIFTATQTNNVDCAKYSFIMPLICF